MVWILNGGLKSEPFFFGLFGFRMVCSVFEWFVWFSNGLIQNGCRNGSKMEQKKVRFLNGFPFDVFRFQAATVVRLSSYETVQISNVICTKQFCLTFRRFLAMSPLKSDKPVLL